MEKSLSTQREKQQQLVCERVKCCNERVCGSWRGRGRGNLGIDKTTIDIDNGNPQPKGGQRLAPNSAAGHSIISSDPPARSRTH